MVQEIIKQKIERLEKEKAAHKMARNSIGAAAASPMMPNAQLLATVGGLDKKKSPEIAEEILNQALEIRNGNTAYLEEILLSQVIALNAFGSDLLMKASGFANDGACVKFPELFQSLAQLGLKAQDQSRKAILALNELKNPKKPSQFIKNYVHQQLNQLQVEQQELKQQLEAATNAPVDIGSESEASGTYQEVEAVGVEHRPTNRRRKGSFIPE
jgi:hypothetical protein